MGKKIVIVGGVAGGATAAARLRRMDEKAQILLLERGDYISYANCGLPYHVGEVIPQRSSLLLQTPEAMKAKFNVDVRVQNEVISIQRDQKTVTVKNLKTGETYEEAYDTLLLSTGSSPLKPPIPGIDSPGILTLWTVPDTDKIRSYIQEHRVKDAVVVGGGFIGLEMAENLHHLGLKVTIVEMLDQVMAPLDFEMAQLLHEHMEQKGVELCLKDGVSKFEKNDNGIAITLSSGRVVKTQLVILSIGVRPNGELAKAAGLEMNQRGGIIVSGDLKTSDPSIYAVGDVIEVVDSVSGDKTMIPLAGPANKQGRLVADNIALGQKNTYSGTQGTSVAKVFDLTAATTGANEKMLQRRGLAKDKDYKSVIITQNSHAGYYPGATPLFMKVLFTADGKKILGAQIVGVDGVDKRIDVLATALRLGAGVQQLTELELAYAPPYSSAKDPVNMAGFTAENILTGKTAFCEWNDLDKEEKKKDLLLLDIREDAEAMTFELPGALHIPLGQLRSRLGEIDKTKEIITFCAIGVRSYNAARILMGNGFKNVKVYPAGTRFYMSTHYKELGLTPGAMGAISDSGHEETSFEGEPSSQVGNKAFSAADAEKTPMSMRIDCSGMQCPGPIMKVFETVKEMQNGAILEVSASDPGFARDIDAWCRRTGNCLIGCEKKGKEYVARVQKGKDANPALAKAMAEGTNLCATKSEAEGKTIIVFSGDMDKVLASFIIANGAAAMGRPVTMFFTFWGLNVLRKEQSPAVSKTFVEKMFGMMMPKGAGKLKLSKMNMGGMGTAMMKKVMKDKSIDSLESLIKKAQKAGVKMVACTMSMDVMGIREEELISGVELGGVGAYLGDAEESNVNLFI